jgi:hypothetical protein
MKSEIQDLNDGPETGSKISIAFKFNDPICEGSTLHIMDVFGSESIQHLGVAG